MTRSRLLAFAFVSAPIVVAACFPDFQVGDGANGSDGGSSDGASGDGGSGDANGGGDGSTGDGGGSDGGGGDASGFDASATKLIPNGSYVFTNPSGTAMTNAALSHDVYFDTHELTAGVLRAWVAAAKPAPCATGSCTLDPGGPYASKIVWNAAWNQNVAAEDYKNAGCPPAGYATQGYPTYNGTDDKVPANCINWYQAAALCWFDGQKRLATQVEWHYVASGRGRGRTYPWGDTPAPSDCSLALWRNDAGSLDNYNGCAFPIKVGSTPMGASFDGVEEMAGSVAEWTWDWYDSAYPPQWPVDFAGPAEDAGGNYDKMARGGYWDSPESELRTYKIATHTPGSAFGDVGVRCVKTKL